MKKFLLGAAALTALGLATPASAADLAPRPYTKAPAMAVAPVYNWTGFYVGLNAGGAWGRSDINIDPSPLWFTSGFATDAATAAIAVNNGRDRLKSSGFTGGGQIGYNWQASSIVYGLEADINYIGLKASASRGVFVNPVNGDAFTFNESISTNWLATFRGRLGFLVTPDVLLYGTGGLAVGDRTFSDSRTAPGITNTYAASISETRAGWTAGAGIEAKLWTTNWTAKLEYLYVDLGRVSAVGGPQNPATNPLYFFAYRERLTENIVRVGLNYHFNSPIVARY